MQFSLNLLGFELAFFIGRAEELEPEIEQVSLPFGFSMPESDDEEEYEDDE